MVVRSGTAAVAVLVEGRAVMLEAAAVVWATGASLGAARGMPRDWKGNRKRRLRRKGSMGHTPVTPPAFRLSSDARTFFIRRLRQKSVIPRTKAEGESETLINTADY